MCFEVGGINRDGLVLGSLLSQPHHDPSKHAHVTPTLPAIIQRLWRAVLGRCVTPPLPIVVYEDNAAQNPPVINARPASALWKVRPETLHLRLTQPIKVTHDLPPETRERES
jgi:hypothetical protein